MACDEAPPPQSVGIRVREGDHVARNLDPHRALIGEVGILDTSGPGARVARNLVGANGLTQYDFDAPGVAVADGECLDHPVLEPDFATRANEDWPAITCCVLS